MNQESSADLAWDLAYYNESLREAIVANPGLQKRDSLRLALHNTVVWAGLPTPYPARASRYIESAVNGACGEIVMEQLLQSEAMKNSGIIYRETSVEDDVKGIDCRAAVPLHLANRTTLNISVPINVKYNFNQVKRLFKRYEEVKMYKVIDGKVYFWPGIKEEELNGRLMLDPVTAEEKGKALVPTLQEAADAYDADRQRYYSSKMGHIAVAV